MVLKRFTPIALMGAALLSPCFCEANSHHGQYDKDSIMRKQKVLGQIFTPNYLVSDILDVAGYVVGGQILKKHVIDNSCGDGAFLVEIVRRYCESANKVSLSELKNDLEKFIHGIEIDQKSYSECKRRLEELGNQYGINDIKWDVRLESALDEHTFDGMMDFVVGNPPYVRVHNLEDNFEKVKSYEFCKGGMTDLYLVFYEIGLKMLSKGGRLCYVAPSSWLNSVAGSGMRHYIMAKRTLKRVIDLGHFQPFNATAYTAIVLFEDGAPSETFEYWTYEGAGSLKKIETLSFDEAYIDNAFYLADHATLVEFSKMRHAIVGDYVSVKNGFATLADDVFIADDFSFTNCVIPVLKASTGKWRKAIFPYDEEGKPLKKAEIFKSSALAEYLKAKKKELLKGRCEKDCSDWFFYGRTQALKDVWHDKLAINTVVRNQDSIKLNSVGKGSGVYGGLYILSLVPEADIREILYSVEFVKYLRVLKKYKSGGYYTFSSKDLSLYLNYKIEERAKERRKRYPTIYVQQDLPL